MDEIKKYPRTPHLEGSNIQSGDEDLNVIPFSSIKDVAIVVEEKIDGANVAISFSSDDELLLQSRGHYLRGGARERDYELFKVWANNHFDELYRILGRRYIMYGEWMYVKHKIYYDLLPSYFMEFDIFDKEKNVFLDTVTRKELLKDTSIVSCSVLANKSFSRLDDILALINKSNYISSNHLDNLKEEVERIGEDYLKVVDTSDTSGLMEGLYIKVEKDGQVISRMKYVRHTYKQIKEIEEDWLNRKIIPNKVVGGLSSFLK